MREPPLPFDLFKTDRVLSREIILDGRGPIGVHTAIPTGKWWRISSSGKVAITLYPPHPDLSRYNRLSLTLENSSPTALLVGLTLVHGSETDGPDRSATSFSGGREPLLPGAPMLLEFPREAFGTYGHPRGWSEIKAIRLTLGRERTYEGPSEIDVLFHCLAGEIRAVPQGPRLTYEGLAAVLCRDVAGVTEFFRPSGKAGSGFPPTGSEKTLPAYSSFDSGLRIPPPHAYPRSPAEEIIQGKIMGEILGHPIPWNASPAGALEWTHFLNRHHFLRDLVEAATRTGLPRYVRVLEGTIGDWIEKNPVPLNSNGGAGPGWETLSAAWRLREWFWVIGSVWHHPVFHKETRLAMLRSVWEHAQHLLDHRGHPNNWIIVESAALTLAGLCFPEFKDSINWTETGLNRLGSELGRQFFNDGVLYEISPLYHAICVQALLEVEQAASYAKKTLPEEFHVLSTKSVDYLAALCRPDFTWPSLNDSGGYAGDYTALMIKAGQILGREDLIEIGSRGRVGNTNKQVFHLFRDAGIVVMRSDGGPQAHALLFRAGPPGGFHHHEDALSLDISVSGRPVLVDPGITGYAPGLLTDYYRSAAAHNMVLIDGKGPLRSGMSFRDKVSPAGDSFAWQSRPLLEIATGVCYGPWEEVGRDLVLLRTVIFVRRKYWIVRDIVLGSGDHEVTACWQFCPGRVDINTDNLAARFSDKRGTALELLPLLDTKNVSVERATGSVHPLMGWVSLNGADVPAPACRYRVTTPLPVTLIWALFPTEDKLSTPIAATRQEGPGGSETLEIIIPGTERDVVTLIPPSIGEGGRFLAPLHGSISLHGTTARGPVV